MPIITIDDVRRVKGVITVRFGKIEREFYSLGELKQWVRENAPLLTVEQQHASALRDLLKSADTFDDLAAIRGKRIDVAEPVTKEIP